jgi:hypothetical protein
MDAINNKCAVHLVIVTHRMRKNLEKNVKERLTNLTL